MRPIDLNCDMGEGFGAYMMGDDAAMLRIVTSANIACGFHAGDPLVMHRTLTEAAANGVGIGAHPGFFDLYGFGRRAIRGERPSDIEKQIVYQIGALMALAAAEGRTVAHVKTHGALGNMAAEEPELARAVARAIRAASRLVGRDLIFVVMPGMETERAGAAEGLPMIREIYADRAYADNGNLVSRSLPGAVLHEPEAVVAHAIGMLEEGAIRCLSGRRIPARIDSICVHGDTPGAVALARALRAALEARGFAPRPMAEVLAHRGDAP